MGYLSVYAWKDWHSAAQYPAALDVADHDAGLVRKEFVESLPHSSPACDAEWTTQYVSEDRLICVFSMVLDLEEDFESRDYSYEAAARATADLTNRLVGTKVDYWAITYRMFSDSPVRKRSDNDFES